MLEQSSDRESVRRYVEAVRRLLDSDQLRELVGHVAAHLPDEGQPAEKVRAALPGVDDVALSPAGSGRDASPYLSRDPMVSLIQSVLESALREHRVADGTTDDRGLWSGVLHAVEGLLHPGNFSPDDPEWVVKVAESMLVHLARGNHPFNPNPAEHEISDSARLVVVGDWGTGLPRAQSVAAYMAKEVARALQDNRDVHVIHLGDVYYSGLAAEYERHALKYWPVLADQAGSGVTSWSLNGNHDMYSGGFGYFDTLLTDSRFRGQRSPDGRTTSFFRLVSPSWDFVGLDTAWDPRVLWKGDTAVLHDPQADYVASVARPSEKKLALFSHHQYLSVYSPDDIGNELGTKLGPVLRERGVTAWWWGHEHRCMGFGSSAGVRYPRCLGHGGVPVLQTHASDASIPSPGVWEERDFVESGGQRWARFGFAVLDLNASRINVRYVNDEGTTVRTETVA